MDDASELLELVRRSIAESTRREFDERVETQAARLREQIESGAFDNRDFAVGLELEAYVADREGRLAHLPDRVLEIDGCAGELGRHNVEVNTPPNVLDGAGLDAQLRALEERVDAAREAIRAEGRALVLDAMWTIPPEEGTTAYLSAGEERDGLRLAANMKPAARYHALDNAIVGEREGTVDVDLPSVSASLPSVLVESLTSSMQPHLQIPRAERFPAHYNAAIRTMGPVLALATNSPFAPADWYPDCAGEEAHALVDRAYHELRIPVFEQAINVVEEGKVRFPDDVASATDVVDRIAADPTRAPFLREWTDGADDARTEFAEFDHKRGTYWRWLRGVVGGQPIDEANDERSLRIEYRPLPTQPSAADVASLQALTAGLIRGLVAADHPLAALDWEATKAGFYGVVREGLDAELVWLTADGERTADPETIYGELFELARMGLRESGVPEERVERSLDPMERRFVERTTPSRWKKARVREHVDDGASLPEAIRGMQREYLDRVGRPFAEWG